MTSKHLTNIHHQHIFRLPQRLFFVVELMSTIDKLNNDILELRNENDYKKKKVIKLLLNIKQRTEHLAAEQEQLADGEIKFVRRSIHFNNQIIREKEKQIRAIEKQIRALEQQIREIEKQIIIISNRIIRYKEKQITADKEKDAANAKFRAERGETNSSPMLVIFFP